MKRLSAIRNLMLSMIVMGIAGSIVRLGTFASFTATTTSPSNTFSSANITFQDVLNAGGAGNTCTSTSGAAASGSGCSVALGSLSTMVPGDSKYGTVQLTNSNSSNVNVSVALTVSDSSSNALDTTSPGSAASSPTSAGLGLLVFECTNSGGTDENCASTDGSGKVKLIYGSCAGSVTTISTALPLSSTSFSTASLTDNGIKVGGTECYGGNTGSGLASVSNLSLSSSLAPNANISLVQLIYFPSSVTSSALQNLSGNSITYTWTASSLAGTSH